MTQEAKKRHKARSTEVQVKMGFDAFCFILNFFRIVLRIGPRNPMDASAFSHSQEPIPEW